MLVLVSTDIILVETLAFKSVVILCKESQYVRVGTIFLSDIHCSPTPESIRKRYFSTASLANLILLGNFCPIVVKVHPRKTSASSSEVADFSRKDGKRSKAHRYDKEREYSFSAGTE
jgi:hypothetical protein